MKNNPWLFRVYRGWNTTQLNGDYNRPLWVSLLNNQDSMDRGSTVEQFSPSLKNGRSSDVSRWFFTRHGTGHATRDLVAKSFGLVEWFKWWCYCWWDKIWHNSWCCTNNPWIYSGFSQPTGFAGLCPSTVLVSFLWILWMFCRADSRWASPRRSATCHGKFWVRGATFPPAPWMPGSNFAPRLANITVDKLDDNVKKWLNAEFSVFFLKFFWSTVSQSLILPTDGLELVQLERLWSLCRFSLTQLQHGWGPEHTNLEWSPGICAIHSATGEIDIFQGFWWYVLSDVIYKFWKNQVFIYCRYL